MANRQDTPLQSPLEDDAKDTPTLDTENVSSPFTGPCPVAFDTTNDDVPGLKGFVDGMDKKTNPDYDYFAHSDHERDPETTYRKATTHKFDRWDGGTTGKFEAAMSFKTYYPNNEDKMAKWNEMVTILDTHYSDAEYPYFKQYEFRRSSRLKNRARYMKLLGQVIVQYVRENKRPGSIVPDAVHKVIQQHLHADVFHFRIFWNTKLDEPRPSWLKKSTPLFSSEEEFEARCKENADWGKYTAIKMEKDAAEFWKKERATREWANPDNTEEEW